MKIKIDVLDKLIKLSLENKFSKEEIDLITDVVLFGELSGKKSHGIVRLFSGASVLGSQPTHKPSVLYKTKTSTIIEGHGNPGMLVGPLAMKEAMRLAKRNGFGIVGTRGSFTSSGCLTYYLEKIAKENLIVMIMAQSPNSTSPYGGIEPLFGTNPISFGIPANPRPFIFDMATSAITFGDLLKAKEVGEKIPPGVALDKNGKLTTDPAKAMEGSTLPFVNSYKGAGLAMIVELLAGLWPGAWFTTQNEKAGWGNLFMAMSPELLMGTKLFKEKVKIFIETVRNSKTKDGKKVRIPGEKTIEERDKNIRNRLIDIDDYLIKKLKKVAFLK